MDYKWFTEVIPDDDSFLIDWLVTSRLFELEDLNCGFQFLSSLLSWHNLTLPLDILIGSSGLYFGFCGTYNHVSAPNLFCTHSRLFLTKAEKSTERWPSHVDNLFRRMSTERHDIETSILGDSAFEKIDSWPLSDIWVVNLSLGCFTLRYSLDRESAIDWFPMNCFELIDFTVDLDRHMRDIQGVL